MEVWDVNSTEFNQFELNVVSAQSFFWGAGSILLVGDFLFSDFTLYADLLHTIDQELNVTGEIIRFISLYDSICF